MTCTPIHVRMYIVQFWPISQTNTSHCVHSNIITYNLRDSHNIVIPVPAACPSPAVFPRSALSAPAEPSPSHPPYQLYDAHSPEG